MMKNWEKIDKDIIWFIPWREYQEINIIHMHVSIYLSIFEPAGSWKKLLAFFLFLQYWEWNPGSHACYRWATLSFPLCCLGSSDSPASASWVAGTQAFTTMLGFNWKLLSKGMRLWKVALKATWEGSPSWNILWRYDSELL
jgi:hypothetical protein